jgi:hypothetical protein
MQKIAQYISEFHHKMFAYVSERAAASVWFAILLSFMALYEVFEHIVIPTALIVWAWMSWS